ATGHSGGVCSRVQETHAPSFRCDRERIIACFSEWIEAVGQTGGGIRGVQKLSEAITVVEPVVKLGLRKDKLGSSKFEEMSVCEMGHNEDIADGNGNGDDGGLDTWFECKGCQNQGGQK
ncbi:hypothetical protein Goklo_029267, partial [Gossypium klotzschianum]|nr:hypothetical protein [Gossypium klotzschianum]